MAEAYFAGENCKKIDDMKSAECCLENCVSEIPFLKWFSR
jgi:hypothetical protein